MTAQNSNSHWVFAYGSLIWKPGFDHISAQPALLRGAHRRLCIYSHEHRGTPQQPGLVFGLVRGGACRGVAYEVSDKNWPAVWDYLQEREQVTRVYREVMWRVQLGDGRTPKALSFVVDQQHTQYAGALGVEEQAKLVRTASGEMGSNTDYVLNTARHLKELGIRDGLLEALAGQFETS